MTMLHNQTKSPLAWEMSGRQFACEPWGAVDLPEKLVPIANAYGLPLGSVPVPPELRAQQRVVDEQENAKSDALRALRNEIRDAKAVAEAASKEVEKLQLQLQQARTQARELGEELESVKRDHRSALADKKAAEDLLAETARAATDSEERAIRSEARLAEATKKHPAPAKK